MNEKEVLKRSGYWTIFILFTISLFWFLFSIQPCKAGYSGGPQSGIDVGINSRSTTQANWQVGSSGVYIIRLGIENVTGLGTATGYMNGTDTYYPRIEWTPALGTFNFVGTGSYPVTIQMNGASVGTSGSFIKSVDGEGTRTALSSPHLKEVGTITATFNIDGLVITPPEFASVNNATGELQSQITTATGSITNHTHTGSDGTTQVSHTDLTNKGTQTHPQIDTFIAKEGQANGLATTNAANLVVRNPASASTTPGTSTIPMTGTNTDKIADAFLSDNVTKLGTPTTSNIAEGSNLYHTPARVNTLIGSSNMLSPQGTPKITLTSPAAGQFLKIVDAQGNTENGTSSMSVGWDGITGPATASAYVSPDPKPDKIPYSTNGNLDDWFSGLTKVITLPSTTTAQVGSTTASKVFVSSSQIAGIPDTAMHANTKLMLRMNGTNTSQVFTDSSTNNYTITRYGNTNQSTSVYKFGAASGYFDGTGDVLTIADNDNWWINTDYTVRGWVYPTVTAAGTIVFDGQMTPDHFWQITDGANNFLEFDFGDSGGTSWKVIKSDTAVTLNAWNHVAVTREGNVYRCFVNGSQGEAITDATVRENNAYNLYIGAFNPTYENPFSGYMDNIEIIKGTALYTGTFTVPVSDITTGTLTRYSTKVIAPGGGASPQVLLEMQTWNTVNGTAEENSLASGTQTVNYVTGSTTVFNSSTQLGTSTLYAVQVNGGILSNVGHFTQCFDGIKVITDSFVPSLRSKYLASFYEIKVKESYARKGNIPWLDATNIAKKQYKKEKYEVWKSANIGLTKYYVDEYLPGTGTAQSFQSGAFETDYNKYIEESWASDLAQNNYVQDIKDEQDMDKTNKMLRPSMSEPTTPAIIKATDGSALNLDNEVALAIMAIQELNERLGSATAEIKELKALLGK